jgi:ethanolamine utilization protein EutQ (cupin superfamily)
MNMVGKKIFFAIAVILLASFVSGQQKPDVLISNSGDWQDVYSVMQYSVLSGGAGYFLVSTRHSTLLINQLNANNVYLIVSSSRSPYVVGYKTVLESRGFAKVEELRSANVNLDLARRLPADIRSFIIIDDSYGYNAVSVAPYAALSKTFVLFANKRNINLVYDYLNSRQVDSLIIYGQVDREVKDRLAAFNPKRIDEGDRFLNNQKIVEMYQEIHMRQSGEPKKQAILTNGEFIEQEIMSGVEPVVFIGRANVPEQVSQYIKGSDIEIGILIGNELIGSATLIRRELGISVFVKFAQSARQPASAISPVEDLDRFYLPRYILDMDIYKITYNRAANRIEVTYQNKVDLSAYLKGTLTIRHSGGTQVLGDESAIFIDKGQFKTIIYTKKSDGTPIDRMQGNITADVFTIFGESQKSLEYTLRKTVDVEIGEVSDNSKLEFGRVLYDKRVGKFLVEVRNIGNTDVFVDLEIYDILVNDELVTIGAGQVIFLKKGESKFIEVPLVLSDADLENPNNKKVKVRAYYGERERSLVNVIEGEFEFGYTGLWYMILEFLKELFSKLILFLPLIVILLLLLLILGMKKKCPHCGEINNLRANRCRKCGGEI